MTNFNEFDSHLRIHKSLFCSSVCESVLGTVHILHHHVSGGWGVQTQMMTLMVPLGGVGGSKAK